MFEKASSTRCAPSARSVVWVASVLLAACGSDYGNGSRDRAPEITLGVNPATIALGQSATLTWASSAGTTCVASGGWTGNRPVSGTEEVTPAAVGAVTYTLTCSGGPYDESAAETATLTVNQASAFSSTPLTADTEGVGAANSDPNLVNPWGIAFGPTSLAWVTNNATNTATLYDGNGRAGPAAGKLVVEFPEGGAFAPTGIVFNGGVGFAVTSGDQTSPSLFIFAGEAGQIAGWAPTVDLTHAITMYKDADGAVYTGLARASNADGTFLFAADFRNNKIDTFDSTFSKVVPTEQHFAFDDPELPEGYSPFGIQAIRNGEGGAAQVYVAYAKQDEADPGEEAPGAGLGLVNVFDANGVLVRRLVSDGGALNAPWGMALAPAEFGHLSNALLVGNFGDGTIHGYDATTGRNLGAVVDADGEEFALSGLWAIAFGNDTVNQPRGTLFYAAGTNGEVNGAYGRIDLGATPPVLGEPPVVSLPEPGDEVSGTVAMSAGVTTDAAVAKVEFFVNGTLLGTDTTEPFSIEWDTTGTANGNAALRAVATDVDGNVGSSPIRTVTVTNEAAATLTQIQAAVFTPRCATCHNGSQPANGPLPQSMDLRAGNAFASLVNVASQQKGNLMRVKPGDSANSYLIHKLEGGPDIVGAQMPQGGPFLLEGEIAQVESWIDGGALNN